jgi:hypothetical protein
MTTPDASSGAEWQTPQIEPMTDPNATSDQMAPVRNALVSASA